MVQLNLQQRSSVPTLLSDHDFVYNLDEITNLTIIWNILVQEYNIVSCTRNNRKVAEENLKKKKKNDCCLSEEKQREDVFLENTWELMKARVLIKFQIEFFFISESDFIRGDKNRISLGHISENESKLLWNHYLSKQSPTTCLLSCFEQVEEGGKLLRKRK